MMRLSAVLMFACVSMTRAFDYAIDQDESGLVLFLTDKATGIEGDTGLQSLHNGDTVSVSVTGIVWMEAKIATDFSTLTYIGSLNGIVVDTNTIDLAKDGKLLPGSVDVGEVTVEGSGRNTISIDLLLDGVTATSENEYQSFAAGVSIIPLVVILIFAATTQIVELSLMLGIFVGACIVAGSMKGGFFSTLDTYILGALASVDHGYVYLFTFFVRSGGDDDEVGWVRRFHQQRFLLGHDG